MMRDIFDTGVGKDSAIDVERRAFALAGFLFHFLRELFIDADISDFKRNGEFVEKTNDSRSPGAAAFAIQNNFHV